MDVYLKIAERLAAEYIFFDAVADMNEGIEGRIAVRGVGALVKLIQEIRIPDASAFSAKLDELLNEKQRAHVRKIINY